MSLIRIRRLTGGTTRLDLDLRSPSGRRLPY